MCWASNLRVNIIHCFLKFINHVQFRTAAVASAATASVTTTTNRIHVCFISYTKRDLKARFEDKLIVYTVFITLTSDILVRLL